MTESAGEPPPEDPVGVRCAGGVTAGLTSEEVGGKAGPLVHLNGQSVESFNILPLERSF